MILSVAVNLNHIFVHGRNFKWPKPAACPRCNSIRLWGHGFVLAFFDGFTQEIYLRRYRCPDCKCITRMKPAGFFPRFQATIHTIRSCLEHRVSNNRWPPKFSTARCRNWLRALKRKTWAFFARTDDLMAAFDQLCVIGQIPVSRAI